MAMLAYAALRYAAAISMLLLPLCRLFHAAIMLRFRGFFILLFYAHGGRRAAIARFYAMAWHGMPVTACRMFACHCLLSLMPPFSR